jgi:hypothetical protein
MPYCWPYYNLEELDQAVSSDPVYTYKYGQQYYPTGN